MIHPIPEHIERFIIAQEGGYVNNPNDPGGETNFGISKRSYPNVDIKNLTREKALDIYTRDYWNGRSKCADIFVFKQDLALAHFDWCVNHGVGGANRMLQKCLRVAVDGVIGPITMSMIQRCAEQEIIGRYLVDRAAFYKRDVLKNVKKREFLVGWLARLRELARKTDVSIPYDYAKGTAEIFLQENT